MVGESKAVTVKLPFSVCSWKLKNPTEISYLKPTAQNGASLRQADEENILSMVHRKKWDLNATLGASKGHGISDEK